MLLLTSKASLWTAMLLPPGVWCLVVDKERTSPGHWLESVLCISFSALSLMVGWREGHPACKQMCWLACTLYTRATVPYNSGQKRLNYNWQHQENWMRNIDFFCIAKQQYIKLDLGIRFGITVYDLRKSEMYDLRTKGEKCKLTEMSTTKAETFVCR